MAASSARFARAAGFSLFEVLAAVAILGLLYTALAQAAISGLQAEGAANRRLQASLLADRVLAELEAPLLQGAAPEIGSDEREEEPYLVETEVVALDLETQIAALREEAAPKPGNRNAAPSLIGVGAQGTPPLLQLWVRVSWQEGVREIAVERSSFGFDKATAAPVLESLASALAQQAAEAEGGTPRRSRVDEESGEESGRSSSRERRR